MQSFSLKEKTILAGRYRIEKALGSGWEGEVYLISELGTGIERAVKLFYPNRNKKRAASRRYARMLHKLRGLPSLIQYHGHEEIEIEGEEVVALISEYIEGEILSAFIKRQPGKRMTELQAALLLYELACGVEGIHLAGEYHGDLHPQNIIVCRYGLGFDVKFVDFYNHGRVERARREEDLFALIRIFYESLGGQKRYHHFSNSAKYICAGLKSNHILNRFKTVTHLRSHLEHMVWE